MPASSVCSPEFAAKLIWINANAVAEGVHGARIDATSSGNRATLLPDTAKVGGTWVKDNAALGNLTTEILWSAPASRLAG